MKRDTSGVLLDEQTRQLRKGVVGGVASALVRNELPEFERLEIERLVADLAGACGPSGPSAEQRAILHSVSGLLAAQWRLLTRIKRGGRGARRATDAVLSVSNSLLRHLKRLDLAARPRPRTIFDLNVRQPAGNGQKTASDSTIPGVTPNV